MKRNTTSALPFLALTMTLALALALAACDSDGDSTSQPQDKGNPPDDLVLEGCIEGDFNPYWGVLHAHTSYSDGVLTPEDAFAYGRDEGKLDILLMTDHLETLYLPIPEADKWEKCRADADAAYAPGTYLTDCGFEYGSGFTGCFESTGHNNVFFADSLFPFIQLDFHDFYNSLAACETCIGQYNHPGDPTDINWNQFEYFPEVDARMNLFEFNSSPAWGLFFQALDAGWHISPMNNQDNHDADWGTRNEDRSGFYLAELTRESLKDAMLYRRSFMSYDKNAAIRMTAAEKCWMGSILTGSMPASLSFQVEAFDLDAGDGFTTIQIFGPDQEVLDSFDCGGVESCAAEFTLNTDLNTYFVARADQADGDWLVAAPIWVEPEAAGQE